MKTMLDKALAAVYKDIDFLECGIPSFKSWVSAVDNAPIGYTKKGKLINGSLVKHAKEYLQGKTEYDKQCSVYGFSLVHVLYYLRETVFKGSDQDKPFINSFNDIIPIINEFLPQTVMLNGDNLTGDNLGRAVEKTAIKLISEKVERDRVFWIRDKDGTIRELGALPYCFHHNPYSQETLDSGFWS